MDESPEHASVGTVRVGGSRTGSRGASLVTLGLIGFVLLAFLKPWSFGGPGEASPPPFAAFSPVAPATPQPSPTRAPDPNGMACLADRGIQVLTLERTARGEVRSWVVVADVIGAQPGALETPPADASGRPVPLYSRQIVGLGICSGLIQGDGASAAPTEDGFANPAPPGGVSRALIVDVRRLPDALTLQALDLGEPPAITGIPDGQEAAILYGPPPAGTPAGSGGLPSFDLGTATWPSGTYALGYQFDAEPVGVIHWLAISIHASATQY